MRINWKQLESKGWRVEVDDHGVTIKGHEPFTELAHVADALERHGLGRVEAEVLIDEFYSKIEGRLILAALE